MELVRRNPLHLLHVVMSWLWSIYLMLWLLVLVIILLMRHAIDYRLRSELTLNRRRTFDHLMIHIGVIHGHSSFISSCGLRSCNILHILHVLVCIHHLLGLRIVWCTCSLRRNPLIARLYRSHALGNKILLRDLSLRSLDLRFRLPNNRVILRSKLTLHLNWVLI